MKSTAAAGLAVFVFLAISGVDLAGVTSWTIGETRPECPGRLGGEGMAGDQEGTQTEDQPAFHDWSVQIEHVIEIAQGSFMAPTWSPDGTKLAFTTTGYGGLLVRNADATGPVVELSDGAAAGYKPLWTLDSRALVLNVTTVTTAQPPIHHSLQLVDAVSGETMELAAGLRAVGEMTFTERGDLEFQSSVGRRVLDMETHQVLDAQAYYSKTGESRWECQLDGRFRRLTIQSADRSQRIEFPHEVSWYSLSPTGDKIAFYAGDHPLSVSNLDGTDPLSLDGRASSPSWSSDGQFLVYEVTEDNGDIVLGSDLYIANTLDGTVVQLTHTPDLYEMHPSFSPDGGRVAYDVENQGEICVAVLRWSGHAPCTRSNHGERSFRRVGDLPPGGTVSGADTAQGAVVNEGAAGGLDAGHLRVARVIEITDGSEYYIAPRWSPGGTRLIFSKSQYQGIYIADADGSGEVTEVTDLPYSGYSAQWVPGSHSLVLAVRTGRAEKAIKILDTDTGVLTDVAVNLRDVGALQKNRRGDIFVSVGGQRRVLATSTLQLVDPDDYYAHQGGGPVEEKMIEVDVASSTVWIMNGDGSNRVRFPYPAKLARLSPTGDRISFQWGPGLCVANIDGSSLVEIGPAGLEEWSPDGRVLVYQDGAAESDHWGNITRSELFAANADGSAVTQLTDAADVVECSPSWSPDGTRIAFADAITGKIFIAVLEVAQKVVPSDFEGKHMLERKR